MKRLLTCLFVLVLATSFTLQTQAPQSPFAAYGPKESLVYRLHYGFVTAGEARIEVDPTLYMINNKVCYKTSVIGATSGSVDIAMRVRDQWTSYIDTATKIPQRSMRNIAENNYRLKEMVMYDYANKKANVITESGKELEKSTAEYAITNNLQDIVSGAYYLRTLDYSKMAPGTPITMKAFFEDKLYDFTLKYVGKEKLHTKHGYINVIKIQPVMPDNELFDGGNSIRLWLSDDDNKIPVKIEADMFVGKVEVELKSFAGLKHPIVFTKK
ncbi:DUF3108 domain-containing protein [Cytophaga hutchinsonii]|nr:DUF3108 domain-containing protein [Cytophaga hutchinsonii]SFX19936.1 Protein of unknown function [Cytophaga hutchinsonii ATCC 33406]